MEEQKANGRLDFQIRQLRMRTFRRVSRIFYGRGEGELEVENEVIIEQVDVYTGEYSTNMAANIN